VRIYACLPLDFDFAKGQEISKEYFPETPLTKKQKRFDEGFLP
jgi:hypothetical protein